MTKLWHGLIPLVPEGWPADEPLLLLKDVDYLWRKRTAEPLDVDRLEGVIRILTDAERYDLAYTSEGARLAKDVAAAYAAGKPEGGE